MFWLSTDKFRNRQNKQNGHQKNKIGVMIFCATSEIKVKSAINYDGQVSLLLISNQLDQCNHCNEHKRNAWKWVPHSINTWYEF